MELNKQHKITLLTDYSQINCKGAVRRHQKNAHGLPPSLSHPLSKLADFIFTQNPTWEPVHRLQLFVDGIDIHM